MLRVTDLEKSIQYYTEALGMTLLRTRENPDYKYTLAFLGYGPEDAFPVMELTYNWDENQYTKGDGYAQVAITTKDLVKTSEQIKAAGGTVIREPSGPNLWGTKTMATVDPDGWKFVFVDEADFNNELIRAAEQR